MSQRFIQTGYIEVSGLKLQVVSARQSAVPDLEQQHSACADKSNIPRSAVVEVSWSHADLRRGTLLMYLENQKRSGGGQVMDMRFIAEDRKAYVRFVDAECKLLHCEPISAVLIHLF